MTNRKFVLGLSILWTLATPTAHATSDEGCRPALGEVAAYAVSQVNDFTRVERTRRPGQGPGAGHREGRPSRIRGDPGRFRGHQQDADGEQIRLWAPSHGHGTFGGDLRPQALVVRTDDGQTHQIPIFKGAAVYERVDSGG